jgi:hypothetical protein
VTERTDIDRRQARHSIVRRALILAAVSIASTGAAARWLQGRRRINAIE